ncbi:putative transposase [Streptococcus pneumoniae 2071004]|nr:putative transposase [Streptococcus pneumoniae 2071004]
MEKCYTDVTEFAIPASTQKLYLSPVLDGFNSEIIAFNLSCSPNLEQVKSMLEQAFTEKYYENTILHSDQGWQYQHDSYHRFLESKEFKHPCHAREQPRQRYDGVLLWDSEIGNVLRLLRSRFSRLSNWNKLL